MLKRPPLWYLPFQIPNHVGSELVVQLHSGYELVTKVIWRDGLHCLRDIPIDRVKQWRPKRAEDVDLGSLHTAYVLTEEASGEHHAHD